MSAELLIYFLVAAGLVYWLRNILGTREEDDLPSKPFSMDDEDKKKSNVVPLEGVNGMVLADLPRHVRIDNKTTENILEDLSKERSDFDFHHFVDGAEQAFVIIIEAFADGDLETLKELLAPVVYDAFETAIKEREKNGETVSTEIKAVEKMDITEVDIQKDMFFITVRFTAREVCVIRDKENEILSGDPDKTTQMVDVWVFGRDMTSDIPAWHLYETRDDEIEDHKTPLPEAGKKK